MILASFSLFDGFSPQISSEPYESEKILTVRIEKIDSTNVAHADEVEEAARPISQDPEKPESKNDIQQKPRAVVSIDPVSDSEPEPKIDWQLISQEAAVKNVAATFSKEKTRASMWRHSRSVMFAPGDENLVLDEAPLMADIPFVQRSRVFGIGLNIGSCFIGIPIAGVDVEDRSPDISVFVCTGES